ncbi:hypothetical protein TspCOW1_33340 [Thiohalobacter sp. COW1]|nr:PilZ domain-containing protein [Thiohalobacter sp. COW1]BCO33231.1 hypothetical protein TspCOW1_33340 [Thiohalobacter sp. COW1]
MAKLTLTFKERVLRIFPLLGENLCIGRDPQCQIHIDSLAVEPQHADLRLDAAGIHLTPRPEAVVQVNGTAIEAAHTLAEGDRIQIGKHLLTYSSEGGTEQTNVTPITRHRSTGWMQIMSGSHFGRTIRLDRALTRVGKQGEHVAMIARRDRGYYLSHLEGDTAPRVNGEDIGDSSRELHEGDRLQIGRLELQFFLDQPQTAAASAAAGSEPEPVQRRRFTRIPFDADARLSAGDRQWPVELLDISLKGALIARPDDWDGRTEGPFRLELRLGEDAVIAMDVSVAHQEEDRLGLRCEDIDLDSITHLRRLVELNLGNPDLLERELASLG